MTRGKRSASHSTPPTRKSPRLVAAAAAAAAAGAGSSTEEEPMEVDDIDTTPPTTRKRGRDERICRLSQHLSPKVCAIVSLNSKQKPHICIFFHLVF